MTASTNVPHWVVALRVGCVLSKSQQPAETYLWSWALHLNISLQTTVCHDHNFTSSCYYELPTHIIRRFIKKLLRAAPVQRVPESRMRTSEPGLRATGIHELDRQPQASWRGCHNRELQVQDQLFTFCRRFGTIASSHQSSACTWSVFCCVRPSRN